VYTIGDPALDIDAYQGFNIYLPPNCVSGETMTMVKVGKPDSTYTTTLPSFATFN
jgi:hypothetical protein